MWATLALMTLLGMAPEQAQLKLTNDRATYGPLGAVRTDNKVLPGDAYWVMFDIEGLSTNKEGKMQYSMSMEFVNSQGKTEFSTQPQDQDAINLLGGNKLPAHAMAAVGLETAPGDYTLKVTVTDRMTKKSESLSRKFTVLPKDFGLVQARLVYLELGSPAPNMLVAGQTVLIHSLIVGFQRDTKDPKQPNIALEVVVFDESTGKKTLDQPFKDSVSSDVPADLKALPISFPLSLNRAGKFRVEITATDTLAKKTAKISYPFTVQEVH
jgi:hypothetical protein